MQAARAVDKGFIAWVRLIRFWLGVWIGGPELQAVVREFAKDEEKRLANLNAT
jgi:hypothetical protein